VNGVYVYGKHIPGVTNVWERFECGRDAIPFGIIRNGSDIGAPMSLIERLKLYRTSASFSCSSSSRRGQHACRHHRFAGIRLDGNKQKVCLQIRTYITTAMCGDYSASLPSRAAIRADVANRE